MGSARGGQGTDTVIGSASALVPGAAGDTTSLLLEDRNVKNMILADGPAGLRLNPHFATTADGRLLVSGDTIDPVSKKYYTYAAVFNPERFPDLKFPGCFYALESEDRSQGAL